eukprot:c20812_g2_i6 orf=107-385(+)
MLTVLMYVMVPMPCLFFGGSSAGLISSRDARDWADAAKFLTGFSAVGSLAIPAILHHAQLMKAEAMYLQFSSFFLLICTVLLFNKVSLENEW